MTINSTTRKAGPFVGTGTVSAFPFGFKVFQASDLFVVRLNVSAAVEQTLVLNSDYSVTLNPDQNSNPGGVVTLLTGALASGYTLTLTSDVPDTQPTDLTNQGGFYPEVINDALDRATIQIQQMQTELDRSFKVAISSSTDPSLPPAIPGSVLGWNATGDALINIAASTGTSLADLAASAGSSLIGYNQGSIGAVDRTVENRLQDYISVKDFGAVGDGVTDDVGAFFDAGSTGKTIRVPSGNYLIGSSTTISSQIVFDAGAKLLVGNGVTVAFTGQVVSGPYQIFQCTGTGAVTFNEAKTAEGHPEWWGALVNNAGAAAANRTAINACITALPRTKLQPADYWIDDYIHLAISHRELIGQGYPYDGATADVVSRIVVNNGTTDAIRVGPNTKPATVNQFPQGLRVMNVTTDRSVAPVVSSDCTGIRVQYVLNAQFENVMARQCIYGWRFNGAVYSKVRDCQSFRSVAGTGGADKYYGFFVDGSINIGLAGGNASLYLEGCNSSMGSLSFADSNGLYANLAFTDLFVYEFETVRHSIGINIQGNASTTSPYSNLDLQIRNPVIDAYELYGIFFNNVNESGACEVIGGYTAPLTGGTASCGILISSCTGSVAIHGTQMIMPQSAVTNGVVIENSANAVIDRTQILDCRGTPMTVNNSVSCDVRPVIKNYLQYTAQALLVMGATTGCYIQPIINGKANIYSRGINVTGTADVRNEYNCTLINSGCLNGGSAKKLVRNGVDITATGLSGTNLVSGVMT